MSEQDLNNETYEMPSNDMNTPSNDTKLVGSSPLAETINAAGGVDPSRFWIVWMILIGAILAGVVGFGAVHLIKQGEKKDVEIVQLRQELKDCPQKTLDDLRKQQQAIEDIKQGVISNSNRIQEIKIEKTKDVENLKQLDEKLENATR